MNSDDNMIVDMNQVLLLRTEKIVSIWIESYSAKSQCEDIRWLIKLHCTHFNLLSDFWDMKGSEVIKGFLKKQSMSDWKKSGHQWSSNWQNEPDDHIKERFLPLTVFLRLFWLIRFDSFFVDINKPKNSSFFMIFI